MPLTSLYIHIPFCIHRCGYCDFNTYVGLKKIIPDYIHAVCEELDYISRSNREILSIHTVYFGGGTPSLINSDGIKKILANVYEYFDVSANPEITIEANPGTVDGDYLARLSEAGVNRISLGMQSAHSDELALLEREHTFYDVINAVEWARAAGINNLNLDLIFGLPHQQVDAWIASLEAALALKPEHLSLYALTLDHGTRLHHKVESGILAEPDNDMAADMYEVARKRLNEAGFEHYEISNWAKRTTDGQPYTCAHNLQYWRTLPYLGVGAGAHGFFNHFRTENVIHPIAYINRMQASSSSAMTLEFPYTPATDQTKLIDQETEIGEMMMMGLRLVQEGISNQEFQHRYGVTLIEKYSRQIKRFIASGLLEWFGNNAEKIRLTERGQLLGNQVFCEFV